MSAPLPSLSDAQRRARLVARHQLAGDAAGAGRGGGRRRGPARHRSRHGLSVRAGTIAAADLGDVSRALYDERSLVRLLAMRRTLFVVPRALVPVVHFGAALEIAAFVRKRLITQLATLPTEPPVPAEAGGVAGRGGGRGRAAALDRLEVATGAQLSVAEPRLRTAFLPTTDKATTSNATSPRRC